MDTKNLKTLLWHVRPVCVMCSTHAGETESGWSATRVAHMPDRGSCHKWYFCDNHDFTSTDGNGRGFDIEDFKNEYRVPWPPPHVMEDLPHAAAVRQALAEVFDNPKVVVTIALPAEGVVQWDTSLRQAVESALVGPEYEPDPDSNLEFRFKTAEGSYWGGATSITGYGPDVFVYGRYDALERAFQARRMYLYSAAGKKVRLVSDRDLEEDGFQRPTQAEVTFRLRKKGAPP